MAMSKLFTSKWYLKQCLAHSWQSALHKYLLSDWINNGLTTIAERHCALVFSLGHLFKAGDNFAPGGHWQCLETFLLSQLGWRFLLACRGEGPGMLINILPCPEPLLTTKNYMNSNINSAEFEFEWSCLRSFFFFFFKKKGFIKTF